MNEYKPRAGPPASPAPRPSPGDSATPQRPQLVMELPKHPEPDEPGLLYFPLNDHGNAQRVAAIYGPSMRYCHAFKKWLLCRVSRRLGDFASSSINARGITDMLTTLRSDPEIVIEPGELDTHPHLLNCLNGTVDLRTRAIGPHDPEHYITKLVHHGYRPEAKCERWLCFISELMSGNQKLVSYLQKAFGYSLTGCTIEKAVFVLFGDGNNGKTTLLSTFRTLIPEYATHVQVDSLMTRSEESNNVKADLADLRGARFAMTSESEQGQSLSPAKLKRITQGMGIIKSVRKYENPIEFEETHKLWLDTNRKPRIPDADDGAIFNRLHPIPFTVIVPKEKIDRDLPGKLLGLWPLGVVLVFELLSGFLAIECPIDRDAISVGSPVPGAGFRPENPDLAESALPQTLLGKEADLQFRLIQPTSVYRRVVNGEPIPQRPTLFLAEAVRQRLLGVGTQVVHDQMDGLRRGIAVGDGLDEVCKFQRRPGRGDLRKVNSCLRFDAAEYIGSSSTFVFIVALGHAARFHGQGFSDIVVKSHRLFIYAHHRLFGRQRPFIDFQHIFHRLDVFVIELGDAPHFFPATAEGRVLATRSELSRVLPWGPVCV